MQNILPLFDFLLFIVFFSAAINGYKRGFSRDFIITLLWLPILGACIYIIANFFQSGSEAQSAGDMLERVGTIFALGQLSVWVIDRFIIRPVTLSGWKEISQSSRLLGGMFSMLRSYAILLCLFIGSELYIQQIETSQVKGSFMLTHLHEQSLDALFYLSEHGYVDYERVLFETDKEHILQKPIDNLIHDMKDSVGSQLKGMNW